jgi:hypothetical protein
MTRRKPDGTTPVLDRIAARKVRPDKAEAVERVETVARNARTIWLGLLAYMAFVLVTLISVEDIDFFSAEASTDLPLIAIAIPTTTFFALAPWIGWALYAYLMLYLVKLWGALAEAPARLDGRPLGDRLFPWLVVDWALRRRRDRDPLTLTPLRDRLRIDAVAAAQLLERSFRSLYRRSEGVARPGAAV